MVRLFPIFALSSVLIASAAAEAAPPISYARVSGNSNEVWLVGAQGGAAKRIYSTSSKIGLSSLDVRPGGGQVAVVENRNSIRVINYDDAGTGTGTLQIPFPSDCQIKGLDYHPNNGSLLFSRSCAGGSDMRIQQYANGQISDVIAGVTAAPFEIRWLRDGSGFLWRVASTPTGQQIRRSDITNPQASTVLWQMPISPSLAWMDIAHTADALLVTWSGPPAEVHRYNFDFAGVTHQGVVAQGQNGHYSTDDSGTLYRVQTKSGYNLTVKDGQGVRTVASGNIGVSDWQP